VYGPVCTVVWEGRSREAPPYPDLGSKGDIGGRLGEVCFTPKNGLLRTSRYVRFVPILLQKSKIEQP
jgi:hypothetical protein